MRKGLTSLLFVLGADIKEFQTELRKSTRDMQKWGRDMEKTGKSMSTYITAPIVAMGAASVVAFRNLNEAMKQVEAGIASTGGAAGYTSEQLKDMADDMGRLTATLNQDILQNVTAQLLTFTNITGKAFEEAQLAALNLSARMGTDLRSSAMMVGRALNDPIQGLTALSRAGVQFTNDQREAVKALIETGDAAGAQAIILQELETQFGGSAEAAGDAFSHMKNASIELGQAYGELISNAITPMVEQITGMIHWITDLDDSKKRWILTIGGVAAAIGPLLTVMGYMAARVIPNTLRGINMMTRAFRALRVAMMANPWMAVAVGVGAVAAAFLLLRRNTDAAAKALSDVESTAAQSIAKQKVEMEQLMRVAKDQNRTDQDRIEALKQINRLMPDHIEDLSLATINTDKAKVAQEAYIESLMKEARVIAAKEKLVEIERERQRALLEGAKVQDQVVVGLRAGINQTFRFQSQIGSIANAAVAQGNRQLEIWEKQEEALLTIINGTNDYADALANLTGQTSDGAGAETERIGILKQINDEIKELRDLEQQATTPQQIAEIRDLITAKEKEIEAVESQIRAYKLLNEVRQGSPTRMTGVGLDDKPDIQPRTVTSPVDPEAIEIMQRYREALQNAAVANNIFGQSFDLVNTEIGATQAAIMQLIELGFDESDEVMQQLIQRLVELQGGLQGAGDIMKSFMSVIESGMANSVGAFAEGIGDMIAGTGTLRGAFGGVLTSLASTLEDLGKLAIATGIAVKGIKESLKTLNPVVAIVGGAALIALAAVVRSRASSMADSFGGGGAVGMAEGGVVPPGYPNDNYPARLTSGEIVVPPKKLESFFQEITQSIVQIVKPARQAVPHDTQNINIHYSGADSFAPGNFTQFIHQVIRPADIASTGDIIQIVRQVSKYEGDERDEAHSYIMPGMMNIPKMAMGGVVPPGFPGDTYPALLSSGEKVVPDPMPLETHQNKQGGEMIARIEGAGNDLVVFLREREREMQNTY